MRIKHAGKERRTQSRSNMDVALKRSDVRDWDDEELQYGRKRDKNGSLCGRPPSFVPKACHDELMRRYHARVEFMMTKALPDVMPELIAIAKGDKVAKQDQVRAMNILIERTMGKVVEHVQMTVEQPWRNAIDAVLVGSVEQAAEVIDIRPVPTDEADETSAEDMSQHDPTDDDVEWEDV